MGSFTSKPNSFTQWQYLSGNNNGTSGSVPYGAQGGNPPVTYRDMMDAKRSGAYGMAEPYPDGYLNSVHTRREDGLEDSGRLALAPDPREAQRAFTRGVHKGERQDPNVYFWPKQFTVNASLQRQASGKRWVPLGTYVPGYGTKLATLQGIQSGNLDSRSAALQRQAPPYQY